MVLTVIPLALNTLTGIAVWMSELPLPAKILLTIILVVKFAAYFYTALMDPTDRKRSLGLVICAAVNILLVAFFVWKAVWTAIPGSTILAILAVVWGEISGFSFKKEE